MRRYLVIGILLVSLLLLTSCVATQADVQKEASSTQSTERLTLIQAKSSSSGELTGAAEGIPPVGSNWEANPYEGWYFHDKQGKTLLGPIRQPARPALKVSLEYEGKGQILRFSVPTTPGAVLYPRISQDYSEGEALPTIQADSSGRAAFSWPIPQDIQSLTHFRQGGNLVLISLYLAIYPVPQPQYTMDYLQRTERLAGRYSYTIELETSVRK